MCSFELTERGRRILGLVICVIDGFLAISGASVAAMGIYLNLHLESKMQFLHGYDTGTVPYFLFIVGVTMLLSGSLFSKAAFDSAYPESRGRFQSFLVFFLAAKFIMIWTVFSASMLCFTHRSVIEESLKNGLFSVMKLYKKDMELKVLIDKLQIEYSCCGSNRFEDWFSVSWVNEDFLDVEDKRIKSKMTAGLYMGDDVPFSCCHVYSYRPCIHHNVTKGTRSKYKPTLNNRGCAGTLMNFFESSILEPSGYFILMAFFVQMLSTLLLRYLHTSIDDAALMEPLGPGTASLCPNIGAGDSMKYVKSDEESLFFEETENHQNGGQQELQNFLEFGDTDYESGLEMMGDFQFGKSEINESSGKEEKKGENATPGDSSENKNKSKKDGKEAEKKENAADKESGKGNAESKKGAKDDKIDKGKDTEKKGNAVEKKSGENATGNEKNAKDKISSGKDTEKKENTVDKESGKGNAESKKGAKDDKIDKGKDTEKKGNAVEKKSGGNATGNEKNDKDNKISSGKDTEKKGNTVDKDSGKVATKSEKDAKRENKNEAQNKKGKSGEKTKAEDKSSKKSNKEREKSHERSRKDKFDKESKKSKGEDPKSKSSKNKDKSPGSKAKKNKSKSPASKPGKNNSKSPGSKSGKSKSKSPVAKSSGKKSKSPKSKNKKCKSKSPKSGKGKSRSPKRKSKSPARKSPKMKSPRRKGRRPKLGRR